MLNFTGSMRDKFSFGAVTLVRATDGDMGQSARLGGVAEGACASALHSCLKCATSIIPTLHAAARGLQSVAVKLVRVSFQQLVQSGLKASAIFRRTALSKLC